MATRKTNLKKRLKSGDLVFFKDEPNKDPFQVIDDSQKGEVSLGLRKFPDVEQDVFTSMNKIEKFQGSALKKAENKIKRILK